MKYISTKRYPDLGPVAYRQWKADSHCNQIHGYSLSFYFEFEADTLDARNWVMDFGGLRPLKDLLEEWFDHTLLVAEDDPEMEMFKTLGDKKLAQIRVVEKTGCEGIAEFFASRFRKNGKVKRKFVRPEEIDFYTDDRSEQECVYFGGD